MTLERGRRKSRTGVVISDGMDMTVVVRFDRTTRTDLIGCGSGSETGTGERHVRDSAG